MFFTYGANLNMVMLVESFLILTIPRLFLINTSVIKKRVLFAKINFLMFPIIRPKEVLAKINTENMSTVRLKYVKIKNKIRMREVWPFLTPIRLGFLRVIFSGGFQFDPPFIFQEELI